MSILYAREAMGSVDAVGDRLEKAAQAHKFGVLNVIDLKAKMASKGVEFSHECRIYEICNPQRAKEVLDSDLSISTALPCAPLIPPRPDDTNKCPRKSLSAGIPSLSRPAF